MFIIINLYVQYMTGPKKGEIDVISCLRMSKSIVQAGPEEGKNDMEEFPEGWFTARDLNGRTAAECLEQAQQVYEQDMQTASERFKPNLEAYITNARQSLKALEVKGY